MEGKYFLIAFHIVTKIITYFLNTTFYGVNAFYYAFVLNTKYLNIPATVNATN